MRIGIALVMVLAVISQSCEKQRQCPFLPPYLTFRSVFDSVPDVDFSLLQYRKGSAFSVIIDSIRINKSFALVVMVDPDRFGVADLKHKGTIDTIARQFQPYWNDFYSYDWKIVVSKNQRVFSITDIKYVPKTTIERDFRNCKSYISKASVNGQIQTVRLTNSGNPFEYAIILE
jgi:hypothetical protein